ncbi:MAG TPA: hypothetical protein VIY49_03060 [Bryobacteraceae bacterium]
MARLVSEEYGSRPETLPPGRETESRAEGLRPDREGHSSGVAWGAVIGGAFAASALYLILLALGAGFGLSAISPWSNAGARASTVGAVAIVWLIVIEIIASAFGGYLTGRLRTKWTLIHTDEVFFRDTANGFLAWAVALVVSVAFLASAGAYMAGSAIQPRAEEETAAAVSSPNMYFADMLFRSGRPSAETPGAQTPGAQTSDTATRAEAARILTNDLRQSQVPAADRDYLAGLVAGQTGMSQPEAEQRVSDVLSQARQAEDAARKATAHLLLWLFLSLLLGAFSASYAATVGGRQRDHVKAA